MPPAERDALIAELLRTAAPMTARDETEQLISLAYGNVKLEDPQVTREMVEDAVRREMRARK